MTLQIQSFRPMSMGQIIDRALRLYRRYFVKFLLLSIAIQLPIALIGLIPILAESTPELLGDEIAVLGTMIGVMMATLVWGIVTLLGSLVMVQMAVDGLLEREPALGTALQRVKGRFGGLLGAYLLALLLIVVIAVTMVIPFVGWIAAIPLLGFIIFFSGAALPMLPSVIAVEQRGGGLALKRVWILARRRFWWILGFFLLLFLFSTLVVQAPAYLFGGIALLSTDLMPTSLPSSQAVIQQLITAVLNMIFMPIQALCGLLVYLDTRMRKEGLDLALRTHSDPQIRLFETDTDGAAMLEFDATETPSIDMVLATAPYPSESVWPTLGEWGRFCLISLGILGILFAVGLVFGLALFPLLESMVL